MKYKAKVFEKTIEVSPSDIDELQHVNNVVYLSYLQEAAIDHWCYAVPVELREPLRWVVRKHEIEYLKPAFLGDTLTIKTWIESFNALSCLRLYEIRKGNVLLIKAQTSWLALDTQTMKPKRIDIGLFLEYLGE
jgi:acyl-CoA thioester hydrolase